MSSEELRGGGARRQRVFAHLLGPGGGGVVRTDRDKVRLASHAVRLSPEQQTAADRLEQEFLTAAAAPPSPEEALARAGQSGDEEHELFQVLIEARKLVRVKESLYFHAQALEAIQDKLVTMLRERKEIGPADIKTCSGSPQVRHPCWNSRFPPSDRAGRERRVLAGVSRDKVRASEKRSTHVGLGYQNC